MAAGVIKAPYPVYSATSVKAYQVLPDGVATAIGYGLPWIEIIIGALLILGLFTRFAAGVGVLLMLIFIAGISQVWVRGLSIDCGCFGAGGAVPQDQTNYLPEIVRDIGLAACGAWLLWRPDSWASLDHKLFGQ